MMMVPGAGSIRRAGERGLTLVEMIAVMLVLAILATMAIPIAKNAVQRRKEEDLRRALRVMRAAIDDYHRAAMAGQIQPWDLDWEYYPPDLESLVEGIETTGQRGTTNVRKFLRRIPVDPMTGETDWNLRSYQMDPDDSRWDGKNVYDVSSSATGEALDGSLYSEW